MKATFTATLVQAEGKKATGVPVPAEAIATLGSHKRPRVIVNLNGYTYRTSVGASGEVFMLPVSAEHREAAGVKAGDQLEVTLELDREPLIVILPEDLALALDEKPGAAVAFERLPYSARKEYVRQVEAAKSPGTRLRRIATIMAKLG